MFIKKEFDFYDLKDACWSGAIDTLDRVEEEGMEQQLLNLLEEVFSNEMPDITEVNDYLWFDDEQVFECLGISDKNID